MKNELKQYLKDLSILNGEFTLSSGEKSNYYIDARVCSLSSAPLNLISKIFYNIIKDRGINFVGGPTIGADPIVGGILIQSALDNYNLNGFLVRSSDKEHGTKKSIEGVSIKGKSVILVEDVVSTGGSLIKAIEKLRSQDSKVNSILSIVDREMGADSKFLDMGIDYLPLFHISELV